MLHSTHVRVSGAGADGRQDHVGAAGSGAPHGAARRAGGRAGGGYVPRHRPHRRRRRGREGGDGEPPQRMARSAPRRDARDGRSEGRDRSRDAAHVALLARAPAQGEGRHPVRVLVLVSDRRPGLRQDQEGRAPAKHRRDPSLREDAHRRRGLRREALVSPLEEGAAGAPRRSREGPRHAVARDGDRLEALRDVRRVPLGVRGGPAPDQHR